MKMDDEFEDMLEILSLGITEPAGRGCGYGFHHEELKEAYEIFKQAHNRAQFSNDRRLLLVP